MISRLERMAQNFAAFAVVAVLFIFPLAGAAGAQSTTILPVQQRISLHSGWELQSSCSVTAAGDTISMPGFEAKDWHKTDVPSTVVAALVADKTYPNPDLGENLCSL